MSSSRVVSFSRPLDLPARLELSGSSPFYEKPRPFGVDWVDGGGNLLLHLEPRPDQHAVVLNSCFDGIWGEELVYSEYPFSLQPDVPFRLRFDILVDRFRVFVDERHLIDFPHRKPPAAITEVRATIFLWRLDPDGRAHPPVGGGSARPSAGSWVRAERNPRRPKRLRSFRFFAILCTWMEEDVVAATVENCFRQGCEQVYVVDNASPDRTVERAVEAGALLARTFSSDRFLETKKIAQMQAVVDEVAAADGDDHVWWLWVDADEFHHGPRGLTLRRYLGRLDRRFRVVGARFFNHLPSGEPAYVEGRHPLDFQRLCYEVPVPNCDLGHSNHPLQRWDRDGPPITSGGGSHTAVCEETLLEPAVPIFFHHFPYRAEGATRRRLERLFGVDESSDRIGSNPDHYSVRDRLRSLDAVYRQRWNEVSHFPPCVPGYVPERRRWEEWVGRSDRKVARWY